LQCAWYERSHANPSIGDMFPGPGVLSMLYANGRGVPRDIDMARRFTCEQAWAASTETEIRLRLLDGMRDPAQRDAQFDLCDSATSGLTGAACESVRSRMADSARERELAKIAAPLSSEQRRLYDKLRAAEARFEDVRSNEIDMTGTARIAFVIMDQKRLRDQFLMNLQNFSRGEVPAADAATAERLDAEMNVQYQKIMHAPAAAFEISTVKPAGVREVQRSWLPLRDAWLDFAAAAYPSLNRDRVLTQLLRLRLDQLRRLPIDLH
jgi:uncharacterized protein YecT (DUF1311 family)